MKEDTLGRPLTDVERDHLRATIAIGRVERYDRTLRLWIDAIREERDMSV